MTPLASGPTSATISSVDGLRLSPSIRVTPPMNQSVMPSTCRSERWAATAWATADGTRPIRPGGKDAGQPIGAVVVAGRIGGQPGCGQEYADDARQCERLKSAADLNPDQSPQLQRVLHCRRLLLKPFA